MTNYQITSIFVTIITAALMLAGKVIKEYVEKFPPDVHLEKEKADARKLLKDIGYNLDKYGSIVTIFFYCCLYFCIY